MVEKIQLSHMFPGYEPTEQLREFYSQAVVSKAEIDPENRQVWVEAFSPLYVPEKNKLSLEEALASYYGLRYMELKMTYPSELLSSLEPDELRDLFVSENSMLRGSLAGAQWTWDNHHLLIQLRANGKQMVDEISAKVAHRLEERFGCAVEISVQSGRALEGEALFDEMEKLRAHMIAENQVNAPAPKKETTAAPVPSDMIFGKTFKGTAVPMKDIDLNMGTVIVEGKVFAIDHKELTKRNAVVVKFDMTDHTSSIRISRFLEKKRCGANYEGCSSGQRYPCDRAAYD